MVIDTRTKLENKLDRRERVWRFEKRGNGRRYKTKERVIEEVKVSELGKLRNEWAKCTTIAS